MSESPEELRQRFVQHILTMVDYWTTLPDLETPARCDGVAFSILTMLDGVAALPRFTVAAQLEDGSDVVINEDCDLHDIYADAVNAAHLRAAMAQSAVKAEHDDK